MELVSFKQGGGVVAGVACLIKCLPLQSWGPEYLSPAVTYKPGMVGYTWEWGEEERRRETRRALDITGQLLSLQ